MGSVNGTGGPRSVEVNILGIPAPQGSKNLGRNNRMYEAAKGWKDWRAACVAASADAKRSLGGPPLDGPLSLDVVFLFNPPRSRMKQAEAGALWQHVYPDLDKLVRCVGDSLKIAGLIVDDNRIAKLSTAKVEIIGPPGARVIVRELPSVGPRAAPTLR